MPVSCSPRRRTNASICETASMASVLLFLAVVAVCGLMLWASYRMEPHWVSKDGERMICYGQGWSRTGQTSGRWREVRVSMVRVDTVEVRPRRGSLAERHADRADGGRTTMGSAATNVLKKRGPRASYWKVVGKADTTLRNKVIYVLDGNHDDGMPQMLAIRIPAKSKAIPMLEAMTASRSTLSSAANRESARSADRPDPD
jgi:hypothetical protein